MIRKPFAAIVTLAIIASVAFAQNCNNPLLDIYGLPGLATPISGSGFPYCQNLQNGQSCCSAATVGTFQELLNSLTAQIQTAAGRRDAYLVQLRNDFSAQYQNLNNILRSQAAANIAAISAQNSVLGNNLTAESNYINDISNSLTAINNDFTNALRDYQDERRDCFIDLLRVQASAWCLACDPNYASRGVRSNGAITFSNDLNDEISSECYDYLEDAEKFNPLIRARQSYERLQNLTTYMGEFANTSAIPNEILPAVVITTNNATQRTVTRPAGCTDDDNCVFQGNNLFPGGVLNQTLAANGAGLIGGADVVFNQLGVINNDADAVVVDNSTAVDGALAVVPVPVVVAVDNATAADDTSAVVPSVVVDNATVVNSTGDNNNRLLQNAAQSVWQPDLDDTGLIFNVVADPAGVLPNVPARVNDNSDDSDSGSVLTVGLVTVASLAMAAAL